MQARSRPLAVLAIAVVCSIALPALAQARTTHSKLRVEADGKALEPGVNYSNRSITSENSNACGDRDSREERLRGANAMGIIGHAARVNDAVAPFKTSDTFDFALIVCRIGSFSAFDTNQAWLYKVNHEFASVSGDQLEVGRSDDVLWYFANFSTGANTGDELDLVAPDRTRPGEPLTVTAYQYDGNGDRQPAANVTVQGGTASTTTDASGEAEVVFANEDRAFLRATRGDDIPAEPEEVCVRADLADCPERLGERFVGTGREDDIRATGGADSIEPKDDRDVVRARDGDDKIDVGGGGADRVDCGGGRDVVEASRNDELEDCEVRR
jgi:hypothetical protein